MVSSKINSAMPAAGRKIDNKKRTGVVVNFTVGKFGWIKVDANSQAGIKLKKKDQLWFSNDDAPNGLKMNDTVSFKSYNDGKGEGACNIQQTGSQVGSAATKNNAAPKKQANSNGNGSMAAPKKSGKVAAAPKLKAGDKRKSGLANGHGDVDMEDVSSKGGSKGGGKGKGKGKGGGKGNKRFKNTRQPLDDGSPWFGIVKSWREDQGFGFIHGDDSVDAKMVPEAAMNNGLVFVTRDDILGLTLRDLRQGQRVQYSLYKDVKGLGASRVQPVGFNIASNLPASLQGVSDYQLKNMKDGDCAIRVRMPSDFLPQLIGQKGAHVKEMRKDTNCEFNFDDYKPVDGVLDDPDMGMFVWHSQRQKGNRRPPGLAIMDVIGAPEDVTNALIYVSTKIADEAMSLMQKLTVVVPEKLIGGVIGKKGAQIKIIRGDNPNMQIHVAQEDTRIETHNGEETVCLVTLYGPGGAMSHSISELVLLLGNKFTKDMDFLKSRENESFSKGGKGGKGKGAKGKGKGGFFFGNSGGKGKGAGKGKGNMKTSKMGSSHQSTTRTSSLPKKHSKQAVAAKSKAKAAAPAPKKAAAKRVSPPRNPKPAPKKEAKPKRKSSPAKVSAAAAAATAKTKAGKPAPKKAAKK